MTRRLGFTQTPSYLSFFDRPRPAVGEDIGRYAFQHLRHPPKITLQEKKVQFVFDERPVGTPVSRIQFDRSLGLIQIAKIDKAYREIKNIDRIRRFESDSTSKAIVREPEVTQQSMGKAKIVRRYSGDQNRAQP